MSTELSKQQQECYNCYVNSIPQGAESQSREDCPVYESMKDFLESQLCPQFHGILDDIRKAQVEDPTLGAGALIVQKLTEEGIIEVPDMKIFNMSLDERCA